MASSDAQKCQTYMLNLHCLYNVIPSLLSIVEGFPQQPFVEPFVEHLWDRIEPSEQFLLFLFLEPLCIEQYFAEVNISPQN